MRTAAWRKASPAALILAVSVMSGCAGMGLQDILSGVPLGGDVRGEIDSVDDRSRELAVRSGWGSRETLRYDSRTRVLYRNQRYDVRDLERGDVVTIDVGGDSRGRRYAETVRVERSVRDSDGRSGRRDQDYRIERFDGQVTSVSGNRGEFGVRVGNSRYQVNVAERASNATRERFRRLRRGDRVRFEGERYNGGRVELIRFY